MNKPGESVPADLIIAEPVAVALSGVSAAGGVGVVDAIDEAELMFILLLATE